MARLTPFIVTFIFGMIGIIIAFIFYLLYANGIMIDDYITGNITIENLMTVTIIIWAMMGVVAGAFSRS